MSDPEEDFEHATRPMSRTASRWFVIGSLLFIVAATIGGSYYLIDTTSQALAPADSTVTAPDSSAAEADSLRTPAGS
jgi:zona occludens toxin (predicted ATPase)